MKKIYSLIILLITGISFGQVVNGNFETWTDATTPTSFSASPFTANVTKETTIIHGGLFSAKHTTPAVTGSVKIQNETATIIPGHSYTISYWYLDNDPLARERIWSYWLDAANATIIDTPTEPNIRSSTYSADGASWVLFTTTISAPATAVKFRFEVRTYAVGAGLGSVYYDDFSVIDETALSTHQNTISGLKVFAYNGNLTVKSDSNQEKSILLYDLLGKQIKNVKTAENAIIDVSNLHTGLYIVKITEDNKTETRKIIIR